MNSGPEAHFESTSLDRALSLRERSGDMTHFVSILAASSLLATVVLCEAGAGEAAFAPPAPERIAALLGFGGPVALTLRIASAEDLARVAESEGRPLASFFYADPAHTSDSIGVAVYAAGRFMGANRAKWNDWIAKRTSEVVAPDSLKVGAFPTADGRLRCQFPILLGPGGSVYGALLSCRDARYELVVSQVTNSHDGEEKEYASRHVAPKKDLLSVIEEIERLVLP